MSKIEILKFPAYDTYIEMYPRECMQCKTSFSPTKKKDKTQIICDDCRVKAGSWAHKAHGEKAVKGECVMLGGNGG